MSKASRVYARPSNDVEVNGMGPLGLRGSRLGSGARCHWEVHARREFLESASQRPIKIQLPEGEKVYIPDIFLLGIQYSVSFTTIGPKCLVHKHDPLNESMQKNIVCQW